MFVDGAPRKEIPLESLKGFGIGDDEWPTREYYGEMVEAIEKVVRDAVEGGEEVVRVMDEELTPFIYTVWWTFKGCGEGEGVFLRGRLQGWLGG